MNTLTKWDIRDGLMMVSSAQQRGVPFTRRTPNKAHRLMLALESRGLVYAAKKSRKKVFWVMTEDGHTYLGRVDGGYR